METRKEFIKKSAVIAASLAIPGCSSKDVKDEMIPLKTKTPKTALAIYYSQTGHTKMYARLIAKIWEKEGLKADVKEYRTVDPAALSGYDLIMVGTPVYYYDAPVNVLEWLKKIPKIPGTAVSSFVSFGGPEGNQHNAANNMLELLAERGGVPVGIDYFMNMSSFPPPKWDTGGTIGHRHLPNDKTYDRVRKFGLQCLANIRNDKKVAVSGKADAREMLTWFPVAGATKLYYRNHKIDKEKCINCGTCEKVCPVGAISPDFAEVKRDKCVFCFGCFNNCPTQAVTMTAGGTQLYNFPEFLKRNKIKILKPKELS